MRFKDHLRWEDVKSLARSSFNIWVDQPELQWAERAWAVLSKAGLTEHSDGPERCRAFARFMVLASFYRDWCAVARDEWQEDEPDVWAEECDVDLVHVGQAVGPDVDIEDQGDAFEELIRQERSTVVEALRSGFGGDDLLSVSLWRSSQPQGNPKTQSVLLDKEEDEELRDTNHADDADDPWPNLGHETDDEILNNPTEEKLAAYAWITNGCERFGPPRFSSLE
jgi:hypothetical protein